MDEQYRRVVISTLCAASRMVRASLNAFKSQRVAILSCVTGEVNRRKMAGILASLKNPLSVENIALLTDVTVRTVHRLSLLDPFDVPVDRFAVQSGRGRKRKLSEVDMAELRCAAGKKGQSIRKLAARLPVSRETVRRQFHREGFTPYKCYRVPLQTGPQRVVRLEFKRSLDNWEPDDFKRVAPSDEFFVYSFRRPNSQNDRIWAQSREDVAELLQTPVVHSPVCVGFWLLFTHERMIWDVKPEGASWNGDYYRKHIIEDKLVPFLADEANVYGDVFTPVKLLHDNAACHKANATQDLLISYDIDFFPTKGFGRYPPRSPDLNAAEHMGSLIIREAEEKLANIDNQHSREVLVLVLEETLAAHEYDIDLFRELLGVLPKRIAKLEACGGGYVGYHS